MDATTTFLLCTMAFLAGLWAGCNLFAWAMNRRARERGYDLKRVLGIGE